MDGLVRLAGLIMARNAIAREITMIIGRPAELGHIGEYIASRVFGVALEKSASRKSVDGRFIEGALAGRSVNIKWYAKREGTLDLATELPPDFYLVLAGPRAGSQSSRGGERPWKISSVHLFKTTELMEVLEARGVKIGGATSVAQELWEAAEIYPNQRSPWLVVSEEQREKLRWFEFE